MKILLAIYAGMSVITFVAYGIDKRAAVRGRRRIRERTLRVLDLLGGFPGGLAAQHVFRHKRRKVSYQIVFWAIVAVHAAAWWLWLRSR